VHARARTPTHTHTHTRTHAHTTLAHTFTHSRAHTLPCSHCLVKVHVVRGPTAKKSTLLFVDLAGSERLQRTGNAGSAKLEAQSINSSLSALGRVIKALGAQCKGKVHIPYRDAPLTMLLRESFGGKSCTSVVINVAAEAEHADETVFSLKFGERMGLVRNAPTVVVNSSSDSGNKERVEQLLERARQELASMAAEGQGGGFVDGAPNSEVQSLKGNMQKLADAEREIQELVVEITEAKSRPPPGADAASNTASQEQKLRRLSEQADVFRGIVERQQTIKTLWALPTPAFRRKAAEVKELQGHLTLLLPGD